MKVKAFCVLIISALVYSCVSLPEPSEEKNTLVVGIIAIKGQKYPGDWQMNGTHKSNIRITLQNLSNYNVYEIKSKYNGLYFLYDVPEGEYRISYLFYKNSRGATNFFNPSYNNENKFIVKNGMVNNFGIQNWESKFLNQKSRTYWSDNKLVINREYMPVKELFQKRYSSSNWNEKEWINNGINAPNSSVYVPPVVPKIEPTPPSSNDEDIWW